MCSGILTLNGPGVSDVLHDHAALAVWEQLRIARRALDLRAVSARCALEHVDALRALDLLSAAGLVERVTAAHRRGIRWRVTCDRIVIAFEPHEHAVAAELSERVYGSHSERVADTIARFGVRRYDRSRSRRHRVALTVRLGQDDLPEFSRRIQSVLDFLDMVGKRSLAGARSAPNHANHAVRVNVEPLAGPVLPLPAIEVVPSSEAHQHVRPVKRSSNGSALSRRERDVADAMARGLTRPAIAKLLGVSANTVGTLSLRIYRKLGVRTRLELAHAMRVLGVLTSGEVTAMGTGEAE
jgi:DNA-binding CsgD family transcriptional regulator